MFLFFFAVQILTPQSLASDLERSFYLMGTHLEVRVEGQNRNQLLKATEKIFEAVSAAESRLSTWEKNSELSRVNREAPNHEFLLSDLLKRDLQNVFDFAKETNFSFNPGVGPLISAWDLRGEGRIPNDQEIKKAVSESRLSLFKLTSHGIIREDNLANIEEGAFGKGIGLDDALSAVREFGLKKIVLDFGGQVSVDSREPVFVEVASPNVRSETLLKISVDSESVSTSGNSEHGRTIKNQFVGHILDPSTGRPSPYSGSVTVVARTGVEADCLSTGLFVMGPEDGLKLLQKKNKWGSKTLGLFIERDGENKKWIAKASCGLKRRLTRLKRDVMIKYDCNGPKGDSLD